MAVKDGLPSTDFSRMNREYIKAVADEAAGGGGGGGGGGSSPIVVVNITNITSDGNGGYTGEADMTAIELETEYNAGKILMAKLVTPPDALAEYPQVLTCYDKSSQYADITFSGTASTGEDAPTIYSINMFISDNSPDPDYITITVGSGRTQAQE